MANILKEQKCLFILMLLAVFGVASHIYFAPGIELYDPYEYFFNAWKIASGTFKIDGSVFHNRFGMLLPMAILLKIFGFSYWTGLIWPILCYLLLVFGIYYLLHNFNKKAAFYCAALLSLNYTFIWFDVVIIPDPVMTGFAFLAMLLLWKVNYEPHNEVRYGLMFTVLLFLSFVTKLLIIFLIPFILLIFILNIREGKLIKFWKWALGSGLLLLLLYHAGYQILTGDFLFRYKGIENEHNVSQWSYYFAGESEMLRRVTYMPVFLLFGEIGYSVPLLLALPSIKKPKLSRVQQPEVFFSLLLVILLVFYWWGSSSFKSYNPIPINYRMWLLLIIPFSVLAAITLSRFKYLKTSKTQMLFWTGMGVVFIIASIVSEYKSLLLLVLISFGFATIGMKKARAWNEYIPPIFVLMLAFYIGYQGWSNPHERYVYFYELEFYQNLQQEKKPVLILVDHSSHYQDIYFKFKVPDRITIKYWDKIKDVNLKDYEQYFVTYSAPRSEALKLQFPEYDLPSWLKELLQQEHGIEEGRNLMIYPLTQSQIRHYQEISRNE